ncbi:MAG: TonB-dependent siderophore receptor, partial [Leptolyngbyaceae cyanobacterium SM1_4_3]|nr:TonB-dependent siderophore receptor [Leptolyngbyaceae cyanobacterium SM1_4_3]
MRVWQFSGSVGLAFGLALVSMLPVGAEELDNGRSSMGSEEARSSPLPALSELDSPAATVTDWVAQIEASLVQITNVRLEETESGLQVILETAEGELAVSETRTIGNALIADIPNAAIAEEFSQENPIEGIALVSVTSLPGDRVRVAITGTDAPPVAEVTAEAQGLVLMVTLGDADAVVEEDAIQVVVTGEQDEGYNPSSATTATRTDTPLRDIPQSIQVVPRQVLEDRNVRTPIESVETVSGVVYNGGFASAPQGSVIIRGFQQGQQFRNGFRDADRAGLTGIGTVEQVEVLRGPTSVLFGAVEPGGIINVITRQPLSEPYYNITLEAGNRAFFQPSLDLSGPLTADETLLYRFIASFQNSDSFQEFATSYTTTVAPSLTFNFGDNTNLDLYYEYIDYFGNPPEDYSFLFSDGAEPPRDFYLGYPDFSYRVLTTQKFGYSFNHEFSDSWQIRNNVAVAITDAETTFANPSELVDGRFLVLDASDRDFTVDNYFGQIDLLGEFDTGAISHQLLIGFDYNYREDTFSIFTASVPNLDIFDPNYDIPRPNDFAPAFSDANFITTYGVFLQDQISLLANLKLLIGGRVDWISQRTEVRGSDTQEQDDSAFSPRIGLVYQPSDTIALYTSYSRSFLPTFGLNADGEAFEPTRGTQYEAGAKVDFLDGRLSATLAAYEITRSNITTPDPDNRDFSIQVGEQRSRGIEFDVGGEVLPGWNIIASYAHTNAEVTED